MEERIIIEIQTSICYGLTSSWLVLANVFGLYYLTDIVHEHYPFMATEYAPNWKFKLIETGSDPRWWVMS